MGIEENPFTPKESACSSPSTKSIRRSTKWFSLPPSTSTLFGEGRKVALLMAGLPHNISSLLNNKTVSFLRALEPQGA